MFLNFIFGSIQRYYKFRTINLFLSKIGIIHTLKGALALFSPQNAQLP